MITCIKPPVGWYCTRDGLHEGPCAALPVAPKVKDLLFLTEVETTDLIQFTTHACNAPSYRFTMDMSGPIGYMITIKCICGASVNTCDMDTF